MACSDPVDLYCERLAPGLWAEPLNAWSNLGFIVAGAWLLISYRRERAHWTLQVLAALMLLIGLCSGAFHTFATQWAQLLDVLSIGLYITFFVACYLRHRWHAPWWLALLGMVAFYGFGRLITAPFAATAFNGSVSYFPALAALLLFGLASGIHEGWRRTGPFFAAAAVFVLSLTLRSLDLSLCPQMPIGTHWAWHLLNAAALTLSTWGIAMTPSLRNRLR